MPENRKQKKGLGKGLGALFMDTSGGDPDESRDIIHEIEQIGAPAADGKNVVMLKLIDIEPNKGQPRKQFDPEKLAALEKAAELKLIDGYCIGDLSAQQMRAWLDETAESMKAAKRRNSKLGKEEP